LGEQNENGKHKCFLADRHLQLYRPVPYQLDADMAAEGDDRWYEAIRKILDPSDGLYAAGGVERL
jgi:hypothetical protein